LPWQGQFSSADRAPYILITTLSKNVVRTGSIRDEQYSFVVGCPVERKIVGLVKRKPARCAEPRSFGRKLGDVDINLGPSPVKYETLAIGSDAGFSAQIHRHW
jgi:hypothetical protein